MFCLCVLLVIVVTADGIGGVAADKGAVWELSV